MNSDVVNAAKLKDYLSQGLCCDLDATQSPQGWFVQVNENDDNGASVDCLYFSTQEIALAAIDASVEKVK